MKRILSITCAVMLVGTSALHATTLSFTRGATESADAQIFAESRNVTIGSDDVIVDFLASDLTIGEEFSGLNWQEGGSFLAAGTYDSTLIHFDPSDTQDHQRVTGQVTFDTSIVAIILSNASKSESTRRLLNMSDSVFGIPGATYLRETGRRAENKDKFTLVNDRTLSFDFHTLMEYIDNVRVITEAQVQSLAVTRNASTTPVPVPASLPLLLAGFGGLAWLRRRSKQRA